MTDNFTPQTPIDGDILALWTGFFEEDSGAFVKPPTHYFSLYVQDMLPDGTIVVDAEGYITNMSLGELVDALAATEPPTILTMEGFDAWFDEQKAAFLDPNEQSVFSRNSTEYDIEDSINIARHNMLTELQTRVANNAITVTVPGTSDDEQGSPEDIAPDARDAAISIANMFLSNYDLALVSLDDDGQEMATEVGGAQATLTERDIEDDLATNTLDGEMLEAGGGPDSGSDGVTFNGDGTITIRGIGTLDAEQFAELAADILKMQQSSRINEADVAIPGTDFTVASLNDSQQTRLEGLARAFDEANIINSNTTDYQSASETVAPLLDRAAEAQEMVR